MMNLVSKSWSRLLVVLTLGIATANPVPPPVFDINHATLIEADAVPHTLYPRMFNKFDHLASIDDDTRSNPKNPNKYLAEKAAAEIRTGWILSSFDGRTAKKIEKTISFGEAISMFEVLYETRVSRRTGLYNDKIGLVPEYVETCWHNNYGSLAKSFEYFKYKLSKKPKTVPKSSHAQKADREYNRKIKFFVCILKDSEANEKGESTEEAVIKLFKGLDPIDPNGLKFKEVSDTASESINK